MLAQIRCLLFHHVWSTVESDRTLCEFQDICNRCRRSRIYIKHQWTNWSVIDSQYERSCPRCHTIDSGLHVFNPVDSGTTVGSGGQGFDWTKAMCRCGKEEYWTQGFG